MNLQIIFPLIMTMKILNSTFSNIGFLKHTNNTKKIELIDKFNFETLSLGQLKHDINEIEPITRNSTIINFSLESLQSNVINYKLTSPNGLIHMRHALYLKCHGSEY